MQKKQSKFLFGLSRFLGFMKLFLRNKKSIVGLFIIGVFTFMALFPNVLTHYSAMGDDPSFTGALAGKSVAPAFLREVPTWLGGDPTLSGNLEAVTEPSSPKPIWEGGEWNLSSSANVSSATVEASYNPDVSYPSLVRGFQFSPQPGSLQVTYERLTPGSAGKVTAYVFDEFDYPFLGPPKRVLGNVNVLVNGSSISQAFPVERWFVIMISARFTGGFYQPVVGDISLGADNTTGLFVAASNITVRDWLIDTSSPNPKNWWDWLNGTATSRHNWDAIPWIVSEGSLTNKTYGDIRSSANPPIYDDSGDVQYYCFANDTLICDPDLTTVGNTPDIVRQEAWASRITTLARSTAVDDTRVYLSSVDGIYQGDYLVVGGNGSQQICRVSSVGDGYVGLDRRLIQEHITNEQVINQKMILYQNVTISKRLYVVVKAVVTEPRLFELKINTPPNCTLGIYSLEQGLYNLPYGKTVEAKNMRYNKLAGREYVWIDGSAGTVLKVPISLKMFVIPAGSSMTAASVIYPPPFVLYRSAPPSGFYVDAYGDLGNPGGVYIIDALSGPKDLGGWIVSKESSSSRTSLINEEDAIKVGNMFGLRPGRYVVGFEITFQDTMPEFSNDAVLVTVNIDDIALKSMGTSYGILGADQEGRDLFAQLVWGARISLYIGLLVAFIAVSIGVVVGLVAGYVGGAVDQLLMRFNDLLLVLPGLPLLIILVAVLGARIENLIFLLGILGWNGFARVVRSQVLSLRERTFVEAAKAAGAGTGHILLRHILPSVMSLVYISLATAVPGAITAEAALAWLGFYDPNRMSWGRMLHEVFAAGATKNWWWIVPPGVCIALIAVSFILLGYALDEILNPKLRVRK